MKNLKMFLMTKISILQSKFSRYVGNSQGRNVQLSAMDESPLLSAFLPFAIPGNK